MKTSDLTGAALDWAVAKIVTKERHGVGMISNIVDGIWQQHSQHRYSTDWSKGGPIIEREGINLQQFKGHPCRAFKGTVVHYEFSMFAPEGKPLIAAMRCFVASRLGDEVEIPEELL